MAAGLVAHRPVPPRHLCTKLYADDTVLPPPQQHDNRLGSRSRLPAVGCSPLKLEM